MQIASITKCFMAASIIALATGAEADGYGRGPARDYGPPPFSWAGTYMGVNIGYAWGSSDARSGFACDGAGPCTHNAPADFAAFGAASTGSISPDGFTGGAQIGYNWQSGSAVLGVEADVNAFDVRGARTGANNIPTGAGTFATTASVASDWLITLRARLGWALTRTTMLYATGGLALTELRVGNAFSTAGLVSTGSNSNSRFEAGWTLGGGLETALSRNWTLKGEYLYVDFGRITSVAGVNRVPAIGNSQNLFATTADLSAHLARLGLNYKF